MVRIDISSRYEDQINKAQIPQVIEKTLAEHGINSDVEVSLVVVGERKMRELHKKYMVTDETTDVLSFPLEGTVGPDGVLRLGDIVVCYPVAISQASENKRLVDEEIDFLVEHACLHLLGIHHE
jgi:probable rRNA maturation factor